MLSSALVPRSVTRTTTHLARPSALQLAQALGATHCGPGLLVVSPDGHCVFRNRHATSLMRELQWPKARGRVIGSLPTPITTCVNDLLELLQRYPNRVNWNQVELARVLSAEWCLVLARFYAIPADDAQTQLECVVGLLEPLPITESPSDAPPLHFRFSEREGSCVTHLMQGMTDKEIANQLGISEYTVKAHLKQIRKKTGACNRAGIIARVLGRAEAPHVAVPAASSTSREGITLSISTHE